MAHQISVFMENKPAHLERMTAVLEETRINIRAITIATGSSGCGVLNLLVDQPEKACEALRESHHTAILRQIMVVELDDHPGGLRKVLTVLREAGFNIENAYGSVLGRDKKAILVIDVENVDQAEESLVKAGIKPLSSDEIDAL